MRSQGHPRSGAHGRRQARYVCLTAKSPGTSSRDSSCCTGKLNYSRAFGVRSLKPGVGNEPLTTDSVIWVASCTKLVTTIAAMQCVERGLVTLDRDVRSIVPEL
jgi:hypothetical protein